MDKPERSENALDHQEGGSHYKDMAIQPVEYIHRNGIGFIEGCCIKYLSRWRQKGGIDDLKKARHFIDLLIQMESIDLRMMENAKSESAAGNSGR